MPYLRDLLLCQLGTESTDTFGCDTAPSVRLEGIDSFNVQQVFRDEQVSARYGTLAPAHVAIRTQEEATAAIGGLLSYDDVPYWLDALFGRCDSSNVGGYATDASSNVIRTYNAPLITFDTNLGDPRIFTFVQGPADSASDNCYNIQGAVAKSASFTFETGAPARFSVDFIGCKSRPDELDLTKATRSVTYIMGNHCTSDGLCIDVSSDTVGTTPIENTAFRAELSIETNRALVRHLGDLCPDGYRNAKWSGRLALSMEMTSTTAGYLDALLAGTSPYEKVIKLKFATGANNYLEIHFNGVLLEQPSTYTDADGIITVDMSFTGQYNATLANWLQIISKNTVVALA